MLPVDAGFEVQVLGSSTSCASCQANGLSGLDYIAAADQVLGVVAVDGLQSRRVPYDDDVAVGPIYTSHTHDAAESTADGIVGPRLDVGARMSSSSASVRRDDLASGQGEAILPADSESRCIYRCLSVANSPGVATRMCVFSIGVKGGACWAMLRV